MPKKLVHLTRNLIKSDQPLLVPIYKPDGTLLAQKGIVLTEDQVRLLGEHDSLYTLGKELASLNNPSPTLARSRRDENGRYIWRSPFARLEQMRNELIAIYSYPDHSQGAEKLKGLVRRVSTICEESPDVALATIMIDLDDYYTATHALHVGIICDLTASYLDWDEEHRTALVGAALSMNISIADFQDRLQRQKERLNEEQRKVVHSHPLESVKILQQMGVEDSRWLAYVEKHHETFDGTGYPNGLMGEEVPLGASILHLADVYGAKVSSARSYRGALPPSIAAREIFLGKDRRAKGTAIEILVKILGLYPPGCQVQLASGETGVVVRRGNRVDAPHVRVIVDARGERMKAPVMRNTSNLQFAVKDVVLPNVIKYDPDYASLWGYAAE